MVSSTGVHTKHVVVTLFVVNVVLVVVLVSILAYFFIWKSWGSGGGKNVCAGNNEWDPATKRCLAKRNCENTAFSNKCGTGSPDSCLHVYDDNTVECTCNGETKRGSDNVCGACKGDVPIFAVKELYVCRNGAYVLDCSLLKDSHSQMVCNRLALGTDHVVGLCRSPTNGPLQRLDECGEDELCSNGTCQAKPGWVSNNLLAMGTLGLIVLGTVLCTLAVLRHRRLIYHRFVKGSFLEDACNSGYGRRALGHIQNHDLAKRCLDFFYPGVPIEKHKADVDKLQTEYNRHQLAFEERAQKVVELEGVITGLRGEVDSQKIAILQLQNQTPTESRCAQCTEREQGVNVHNAKPRKPRKHPSQKKTPPVQVTLTPIPLYNTDTQVPKKVN
jgi:hypothetical protein